MQCTKAVNRPSATAYIRFFLRSNNTQVYGLDVSTDTTNVIYSNFTLIFFTQYTWIPVSDLFRLFLCNDVSLSRVRVTIFYSTSKWTSLHVCMLDEVIDENSGVVTGTEFCGPQSKPILDPNFWPFTIFNSIAYANITGLSTTSTTTIIPNVTTAGVSTTTANPAVTTSGITVPSSTTPYTGMLREIIFSLFLVHNKWNEIGTGTSSTVVTTVITTTTSTATSECWWVVFKQIMSSHYVPVASTTATTTTMSTTLPPVQIVEPSDIIKQCQQPLIVGTLLTTVGVGAVSAVVFGVVFSKLAASML